MKIYPVFFLLLLLNPFISGQDHLIFKVSRTDGLPIRQVSVRNNMGWYQAWSDSLGIFISPRWSGQDTLFLEHINYQTKALTGFSGSEDTLKIYLIENLHVLPQLDIVSSWVDENSSVVHSTFNMEQITRNYIVQDVPYLIQHLPSTYSTSDAGNGIGYTGVRIRGLDPTQVNVMINGIALNDAESQSVYWVDLPDLIASASDIQVQRGIGLSGAGQVAFGSSILINTNRFNAKPFLNLDFGAGSFNTLRSSITYGSGNLAHQWNIQGRLSRVHSDGYIDRASSDLYSGALSVLKTLPNRSFRFHLFHGLEKTYQAWNGVPEQYIYTDKRTFNSAGSEKPGAPYSNQIDKYQQLHLQFIHHEALRRGWSLQNTLHYTPGGGYYEEYKANQQPGSYSLPGADPTDLVRRRYLSNDFLGSIHTIALDRANYKVTGGVAWNYYDGRHFGRVIQQGDILISKPVDYYRFNASKWTDMFFGKVELNLKKEFTLLGDVQLRNVAYRFTKEADIIHALNKVGHHFIQPKLGFHWQVDKHIQFFGFSGLAFREPNRDDYVNADQTMPKPERLLDHELGLRLHGTALQVEQNFYSMNYRNQLVPTGKLNDVGSYVRSNVARSFRTGSETTISWTPRRTISFQSNFNFSKNITRTYTEYIDNWDRGEQESVVHQNKPIAFSPTHILNISMKWNALEISRGHFFHHVDIEPVYQSIGDQFLDGTGNAASLLKGYNLRHLNSTYVLSKREQKILMIQFEIINLLNTRYESNGWIYRFRSSSYNPVADDPYSVSETNDLYHQKGLFPQAGRHFLLGFKFFISK
jgi:iron complex outermembrane receptor protein